jgi:hypothetical protein
MSRRPLRTLAIGGAVIAVGALAVLARPNPARPTLAETPVPATPPPTMVVLPDIEEAETPTGAESLLVRRHNPAGATLAGVRAATMVATLLEAPLAQAEAMAAALATPEGTEAMARSYRDEVAPIKAGLDDQPGTTVFRQAALATKVLAYSDDAATVAVWQLTVMGKDSTAGGPLGQFSTTTVELVWVDDAWRLAGSTSQAGPVPAPGPLPAVPASSLSTSLAGFSDWR